MFAPKFRIAAGLVLGHSFLAKNHRNDSPSSSSLVQYRPDSNRYQRIDSILESAHPEWKSNNAFHGTLQGENLIEKYEVYANSEEGDIICLVKYGCSLNGHTGIIHGGITAITFDNSFGWLFLANKTPPAFTANLSINYRRKIPENSIVILRAKISESHERKLFMTGTMEDVSGNILADSSSLFIIMRDAPKDAVLFPSK